MSTIVPKVGQTVKLAHQRFGNATVKVVGVGKEFIDVEIVKGRLSGMRGEWGPGDRREFRIEHCKFEVFGRCVSQNANTPRGITPGSWYADPVELSRHNDDHVYMVLTPGDDRCVAEVHGDSAEEGAANARLIAAAPDMLSLLREFAAKDPRARALVASVENPR